MGIPANVKDLSLRELRELVKKRDFDALRGFCPERQFRIAMDIGEQAFISRKRTGLSLKSAAGVVGVSKVTLIKYERNAGSGIVGYIEKLQFYELTASRRVI